MTFFKRDHTSGVHAWLLTTAIIFFSAALLVSLAAAWQGLHYGQRAYPGLRLGQLAIGGRTETELAQIMRDKIDELEQSGITVAYGGQKTTLYPIVASADAELAYNLIDIDPEQTVRTIMAYGRNGSLAKRLADRSSAYFFGQAIEPSYAINQAEVRNLLKKTFSSLEKPGQNARLVYNASAKGEETFAIDQEKSGYSIDYDRAITQLGFRLAWLDFSPIELSTVEDVPTILKRDISNADTLANGFLELAPLTLRVGSSSWMVARAELGRWLELRRAGSGQAGAIVIGLEREAAQKYLDETVAKSLDRAPTEAKFQITAGRVTAFQTSQDGQELDRPASLDAIETAFFGQKKNDIELIIKKVASQTSASSTDNLGVTEIIGTGQSNFSGSPANRRHNIRTGANALSGRLIKPGETFSVMKNLGEIDASTGYLPELVIKGNKTTPEYGGGLCQVGTTMFRAALGSGLPIVERRNHSYRVSYYEPAGTDATIYDPAPDLKFLNDTGNYVLIQSRIEGNNLYFDFWGTKDGRVATRTYPTIYNIVKPKATKLIETTSLKPGQKKCTEKAHNGADAYFDYTVTYATGETKKKRFSSHYIPWQEVCLIGVDTLKAASSTPASPTSTPPATTPGVSSATTTTPN